MSTNREQDQHDLMNAVSELRGLVEKSATSAESLEKIEKIEKDLDKQEKKNQDLVNQIQMAKAREDKLADSIKALEKMISRAPVGGAFSKEKSDAVKAFEDILVKGDKSYNAFNTDLMSIMTATDKKYLRTDSDPEGGYLAPPDYVAELIKKITEISPIRAWAKVRTTTRESIILPVRQTLVSSSWIGEGSNSNLSNSTYASNQVKVNKIMATTVVTTEQLTDAAFNMEAEINSDFAEEYARQEGFTFINGNGVNQPQGILSNLFSVTNPNGIEIVPTGIANDLDGDAIIKIQGQLKVGYNPVYILNRKTLARIRRLKDGIGQYLWTPGLSAGLPNTINGEPYVNAIDVPDIGTNTFPIIYGDLGRGYTIVDNISLSVIRDPYTLAQQGQVRFIATRRVGGQVTLTEAIKVLKCSVS